MSAHPLYPDLCKAVTRAEAAEAKCARLEGVVQRVVNCRESQHLPVRLMDEARAALQQETVK